MDREMRRHDVITKALPNDPAAKTTKATPPGIAFDSLYRVAV